MKASCLVLVALASGCDGFAPTNLRCERLSSSSVVGPLWSSSSSSAVVAKNEEEEGTRASTPGAEEEAGGGGGKKIWVCSNRWCRERGASIPLGTAIALTADREDVSVEPHKCFGRCNVGPNVAAFTERGTLLEFHKVDTVEKVCGVLEQVVDRVDWRTARCLEWNARAARLADRGDFELATSAYGAAVEAGTNGMDGVALVGRAEARLGLARGHAAQLAKYFPRNLAEQVKAKQLLLLATLLPPPGSPGDDSKGSWFWRLFSSSSSSSRRTEKTSDTQTAAVNKNGGVFFHTPSQKTTTLRVTSAATLLALRFVAECLCDETTRAKVDFESHMHEIEVRRALDDALQATDLLPSYARTWKVAAEAMAILGDDRTARAFRDLAAILNDEQAPSTTFASDDDDDDDADGDQTPRVLSSSSSSSFLDYDDDDDDLSSPPSSSEAAASSHALVQKAPAADPSSLDHRQRTPQKAR